MTSNKYTYPSRLSRWTWSIVFVLVCVWSIGAIGCGVVPPESSTPKELQPPTTNPPTTEPPTTNPPTTEPPTTKPPTTEPPTTKPPTTEPPTTKPPTTEPPTTKPPTTALWNKEKASLILESSSKQWHQNASARRSDGKTACLSCHTTFTYVMARTLFRKRFKLKKTSLEVQLFKDIAARVERKDDAPAWYNSSPEKIQQSHGSESVLNAVSLSFRDAVEEKKTADDVTLLALDLMWKRQATKGEFAGSWAWLDFGLGPWEDQAARYWGAAIAAIAVGMAPGNYASKDSVDGYANSQALQTNIKRLRTYLMKPYHEGSLQLYDQVMLLWASSKLPGLLNASEQKDVIKRIEAAQQADGGWSLMMMGTWKPKDRVEQERMIKSDGYATGLVVYILRQADPKQTKVSRLAGIKWLQGHQESNGGWSAPSINRSRKGTATNFMEDVATAYAMMALSEQP